MFRLVALGKSISWMLSLLAKIVKEGFMSHHVDTATARKDGRVNLCDLYVFESAERENTIFILTVNPDAGRSSPTTFHPEARYAFKIDMNGDASEDITNQLNFTEPTADGLQSFQLRRIEGPVVETETQGVLLAEGQTNTTTPLAEGGRVWIGLAGDPFFADGAALNQFVKTLSTQNTFDASVFEKGNNIFAKRNVSAIVLEVPNIVFGEAAIGVWTTTVVLAHGASAQISRWSTPLLTHIFLLDPQDKNAFNSGHPSNDKDRFSSAIASTVAKVTSLAHTTANPEAYGERVANLLLPGMLYYHPGTVASYGFAGQNGRPLTDDAMDLSLSLLTNHPLSDHVSPSGDTQEHFPFLPPPYALTENLLPLNPEARKG